MDVLVLTDGYPFPLQNGQALRIYHYVRLLSARHNFDLLCTADRAPPGALKEIFRSITPVPLPLAELDTTAGKVRDAFRVDGLIRRNPAFDDALGRHLEESAYDAIWAGSDASLASIPPDAAPPVLGDLVDDGVLALARTMRRTRNVPAFIKTLKRALLVGLYERRYFGRADHCLLVSEVDARWFQRICPRTPTSVIHNGVDAEFFAPRPAPESAYRLVFEGNLAFGPNSDAMVHFCRDILPLIRQELPQVTLAIVGKDPAPEVQALAGDYVTVTGYVDDIRPYLGEAAVFVSPLRKGAGIKNKLLQAWAMGKASVATEASSGGLVIEEGVNTCIRNGPGEFAEAVLGLLRDPARRRAMGAAARQTILQHYTWNKKAAELEALLQGLARHRRPEAGYARP